MAASFGNYGVLEGDCILTLKTHRQMLAQEHAFGLSLYPCVIMY